MEWESKFSFWGLIGEDYWKMITFSIEDYVMP
jgi:hypothetical protein